MAHDVFLSYSYQDKTSADAVCHSLESKGIRCWIAPRDVVPGADWQQSILDAITGSKAVVLLFTGHTNQSENVKKEVSAAFDTSAIVIPFFIEDVKPLGSLKYQLLGVHWLDAYAPPLEDHITRLAKTIQNLPSKDGGAADPLPPPIPPVPGPPPPPPPPPPLPVPPPPAPGPVTPSAWDDVSLDRREGFAFLAAIIPFAPGLYLLWRDTYRADGDKVAPVSRERKIIATVLAALVIGLILWIFINMAHGHDNSSNLSSASSSASTSSSASSDSSVSANPTPTPTPTPAAPNWSTNSGDGKDREIKFINQSSHSVWHIFAWSTDQTESAGHDVMPDSDTIPTGENHTYNIDDGAGHCNYNFKATRADSATPLYRYNVEVCGTQQVIFSE
jgi:hypothetical protein